MNKTADRTHDSLPRRLIIGGEPGGPIEIYNDDREFLGRGRIAQAPPQGGTAFVRAESEEPGEISDGYHTFNELYEHRHALFLALAAAMPDRAWASRLHADGTKIEGWFIAGLVLKTEGWDGKGGAPGMDPAQISYHLPDRLWPMVEILGIVTDDPPEFDGHTSDDVVRRLMSWARWTMPQRGAISSAELIARTDTPEIRGAVSEQGGGRHT